MQAVLTHRPIPCSSCDQLLTGILRGSEGDRGYAVCGTPCRQLQVLDLLRVVHGAERHVIPDAVLHLWSSNPTLVRHVCGADPTLPSPGW
jgi:hypothetical protein